MTLGQIIKNKRQKLNLSQMELAEEIGISQSQICKIETDISKPSYDILIELSNALKCNVNELTKEKRYINE